MIHKKNLPIIFKIILFIPFWISASLNVPLTVKDGAGAGNITQYPVKVSVPLPSGSYENTNTFRVVDNNGNSIPAQFDILARWWPKNSGIRFVLVQFMADVASGGRTRYFLRDDGSGNATEGITINEDSSRYYVNAGKIKFEVRKKRFNIIDRLWYDVNSTNGFESSEEMIKSEDGNGAVLWDTLGVVSRDTSKNNLKFTMEEAGPLRMVMKVESPTEATANGWGFIVRIEAYYNQPFVVLDYYLKNSAYGKTGHHLYFSKFSLNNSFASLGNATVRLGGNLSDNAGAYEGPLGSTSVKTQSTQWQAYTVNGVTKTGLGLGYADISDNTKGVMAVVRKFPYLWPTGLEVTADKKLSVNLWPQGKHRMVDQTRRSHQILLYFHPGSTTQADLFKQAKIFQQYPVPVLQPLWYAQTHAFSDYGGVGWPSDTTWNESLYQAPTTFSGTGNYLATGWWNWGGTPSRRMTTAGGDWVPYLDLMVPCGSPAFFYHSDDIARHITEMRPMWMDGYTYPSDSRYLTVNYGSMALRPPGASLDSTTWSAWDYQHTWVYEVAQYYFLSGERFCKDYLIMEGDFTITSTWDGTIATPQKAPYLDYITRGYSEPMHVILDAYKVTGEERYWKMIVGFAKYLAENFKSPYGVYGRYPFMGAIINSCVSDIYFIMPDNTPEYRILKEQLFLIVKSSTDGDVYWGGNSPTSNPQAWTCTHHWNLDTVSGYVRPSTSDAEGSFYYESYWQNGLGLMYLMTGDTAYRNLIARSNMYNGSVIAPPQNFMSPPSGPAPTGYYRISSAAWYCPDQKKAAVPKSIGDLMAVSSYNNRIQLQWTSVGGDAYKISWATKPIVQKYARIAPLNTGTLVFPYPDTTSSLTNIYQSVPLDNISKPKSAGAIETFTTEYLPDSLVGKKVYFNIQVVNIASEIDQSRSPISNTDSIVLSNAQGNLTPNDSGDLPSMIKQVYTMNSGELFVTLSKPLKLADGASIGISISHAIKQNQLAVTSVELDTNCKTLLKVHTSGLVEGEQYKLTVDSAHGNLYFLASFRPNVFSPRKIHFGNNYHGNGYEVGHRWDGDCGYNEVTWDAIAWFDWTSASVTDSALRGAMWLNYVPYGSTWFRITVSKEIQDYKFSVYADNGGAHSLQVEDTLVWNKKPATKNVIRTDTLPIKITDGRLDLIWSVLTYVHLTPVFKHFKPVSFKQIAAERKEEMMTGTTSLLNYPNPFNPKTKLTFTIGSGNAGRISLLIYDLRGQLIKDITPNETLSRQVYNVEWNGTNQAGRKVSSGMYCAKLSVGSKSILRKMVFLK